MPQTIRIGLDIGGTRIKAGRVSSRGKVLQFLEVPNPAPRNPDALCQILMALVDQLRGSSRGGFLGLGVPGILNRKKGTVQVSPNLPGLQKVPLRSRLARATGMKVAMENDANCAALGECHAGAGKKEKNFFLLTLGTGVGGGLILERKLWTGNSGHAAEIGHVGVDPRGPRCPCGLRGCVESLASSKAILRAASQGSWKPSSALEVTRAARRGRSSARKALRAAGLALGQGMGNAVELLDIDSFVIGGGLAGALPLLRPHIREGLAKRLYGDRAKTIRLRKALLGNRAGVVGAALLS